MRVQPLQHKSTTSQSETSDFGSIAEVAVLVVGFRNPADIRACLVALSRTLAEPNFDVFICENGGKPAYERLLQELTLEGLCLPAVDRSRMLINSETSRLTDIQCLNLQTRSSNVWIGCATDNLGYAGGINAWLEQLLHVSGWKGVWILNPDTEPEVSALAALVGHAETAKKGMVGSTILDSDQSGYVRFRGGLHWQWLTARGIAIGLGDKIDMPPDVLAVEAALDSPSGASVYATRCCIEKIGLMDESYFLFFEDLDWGVRAKALGLGYASRSVVAHQRGTTTGSARDPGAIPGLSVYLQHRNGIHFVRRHFPWTLPIRIAVSIFYAIRFLMRRAPNNSLAAIRGLFAGLKGEIGRPSWYRN
jgi:N-acetylglucosaminyl-diphospho-decaprenol L-rhamnosyltransferase